MVSPSFLGLYDYTASPDSQYIEDQPPCHGTRRALVQVKSALAIPLHPCAASSPNLNPIEDVWRIMKQRIQACERFPGTIEEMREAVQEEWDELEPEDRNGSIDSMPDHLKQVKKRKGMQTEF